MLAEDGQLALLLHTVAARRLFVKTDYPRTCLSGKTMTVPCMIK